MKRNNKNSNRIKAIRHTSNLFGKAFILGLSSQYKKLRPWSTQNFTVKPNQEGYFIFPSVVSSTSYTNMFPTSSTAARITWLRWANEMSMMRPEKPFSSALSAVFLLMIRTLPPDLPKIIKYVRNFNNIDNNNNSNYNNNNNSNNK